jgi:hypothetical protein
MRPLRRPGELSSSSAFFLCFSGWDWSLRSSPEQAEEGLLEAAGTVQAGPTSGVPAQPPLPNRKNISNR